MGSFCGSHPPKLLTWHSESEEEAVEDEEVGEKGLVGVKEREFVCVCECVHSF